MFLASLAWSVMELPPRARRIRHQHAGGGRDPGTTSACAENTCRAQSTPPPHGNYLRVRGEYHPKSCRSPPRWELPPRARRIQIHFGNNSTKIGTTSACAENTQGRHSSFPTMGNYLRVRGEYPHNCYRSTASAELPPRARRIRYRGLAPLAYRGTTSACAENTADSILPPNVRGNYLRVRGEYL